MVDLKVIQQDITSLNVDAIVNAANSALCGGGGVDGAIHRAAGPELLKFCRKLGRCETGMVKVTPGFNLQAQFIIHAVGPVWAGGFNNEELLLASCYREAMLAADQHDIKSIAFPAISCGAYGFPLELACPIAALEVQRSLNNSKVESVFFACIDARTQQRMLEALQENNHIS